MSKTLSLICIAVMILASFACTKVRVESYAGRNLVCTDKDGSVRLFTGKSAPENGLWLERADGTGIALSYADAMDEEFAHQFCDMEYGDGVWDKLDNHSPETVLTGARLRGISGDVAFVVLGRSVFPAFISLSDGRVRLYYGGIQNWSACGDGTFLFSQIPPSKTVVKLGIDAAKDAEMSVEEAVDDGFAAILSNGNITVGRSEKLDISGMEWVISRTESAFGPTSVYPGKLRFAAHPDTILTDPVTGTAVMYNSNRILSDGYYIVWESGNNQPEVLTWDASNRMVKLPLDACTDANGNLAPDLSAFTGRDMLYLCGWLDDGRLVCANLSNGNLYTVSLDGSKPKLIAKWDTVKALSRTEFGPAVLYGGSVVEGNRMFLYGMQNFCLVIE